MNMPTAQTKDGLMAYCIYAFRKGQDQRKNQPTTGFVQKLRCFFPGFSRTCKDQIPGFSRTQKSFFQDFPGHLPFTNMGCMRSKKCTYKISYQFICITAKNRKCNTRGSIILFNSIKVFLILGLTQEVAMY